MDFGLGVTLALLDRVKLAAGLGTGGAAFPEEPPRLRVTTRLLYSLSER